MRNATKQYSFTKKDTVLTKYSNWFKRVKDGYPNGSNDLKSMDLMVSETKVVLQKESGEKLLSICLKRSSVLEKNWSLIGHAVPPSRELELRLFTGSLHKERFVKFRPSLLFPEFSLDMGRQEESRKKETTITSLIHMFKLRGLEISIRQTLWDPDTSEVQKGLPDSIPFILWMWQGIQFPPASFPTNRPSPFVSISSKHGNIWGFPEYLRWIMRWQLLVEDATPTVSPSLSVFICSWAYIWDSFHKENLGEMPLLKVLMNSGKRECLEDTVVPTFLPLEEQVSDSCSITTMRNRTGLLSRKTTVQDSQGYSEIETGSISDICQKDLTLLNTLTPLVILISLLQREMSPLSEKLMLMVKLRSMALLTSSGEDLKVNMLLLLSLLTKGDWLLNKRIKSSNLFLSQLRVMLFLLYFQLQRRGLNLVYDVMRFLSIKNQFTML